jgi:ABC-2 type transport system ATP-binding protein
VHQPKALILDEPTNGVDPVSRQEFWDILAEMKRKGMTILVSTAYLDEGEKCDQLILMHNGQVLDIAAPHEIQADFSDLEEAIIHRIQATDNAVVEDNFGS